MTKRIKETLERDCCEYEDFVYINALTRRKASTRIPHGEWNRKIARGEIIPFCKHCNEIHEFFTFTDAAGSRDWAFRATGTFFEGFK